MLTSLKCMARNKHTILRCHLSTRGSNSRFLSRAVVEVLLVRGMLEHTLAARHCTSCILSVLVFESSAAGPSSLRHTPVLDAGAVCKLCSAGRLYLEGGFS